MCFSAMAEQNLKKYGIKKGDTIDVARFRELVHRRSKGENLYIPKALEENFLGGVATSTEVEIKKMIIEYRQKRISEEQEKLFGFKQRMTDAERKLSTKPTKTAQKEIEVCGRQIERTKERLERLEAKALIDDDSRIFPLGWAPMMILRDGHRVIVPARYHLRPQGQDETFDRKYDGNYNARRESLENVAWWRNIFGRNHGIMIFNRFFENVPRHKFEKRDLRTGEKPENLVLEFTPSTHQAMYVAVLYDLWPDFKNPEFYSAAAITMEPPPEIAATGHERCIVPIPESLIDAWMTPGKPLADYYRILDQRVMPVYQHRIAI